jgi:hypothetical protein
MPPHPYREERIEEETFKYVVALATQGVPMYFNLLELHPIRYVLAPCPIPSRHIPSAA